MSPIEAAVDPLAVTRVRHPLKLRNVAVSRVASITPHLVRVTLRGAELQDFNSASFDDHVKVFFPRAGDSHPILPALGPEGPHPGSTGPRPIARDFTPRRFDPHTSELDIEFALHDAGPATQWAAAARPGQYLGIGGPRGSMIIPTAFDWHLLVGDDTALPAIARRLEELPATVRAIVVVEVGDAGDRVDFSTVADARIVWCYRALGEDSGLLSALHELPALPDGEGFAWAAAESAVARRVRTHLCTDRGLDKSRVRAAAYWQRGEEAVHQVINE